MTRRKNAAREAARREARQADAAQRERRQQSDAEWFAAHPGRRYRMRWATPDERNAFGSVSGVPIVAALGIAKQEESGEVLLAMCETTSKSPTAQALIRWYDAAPSAAAVAVDGVLRLLFAKWCKDAAAEGAGPFSELLRAPRTDGDRMH